LTNTIKEKEEEVMLAILDKISKDVVQASVFCENIDKLSIIYERIKNLHKEE
jgi:hypothetical protein